jgi:hypothetical protein
MVPRRKTPFHCLVTKVLTKSRGDSWRAQVSHICELQVSIAGGMKIDFGGLDRWDYSERKRNLDEAVHLVV